MLASSFSESEGVLEKSVQPRDAGKTVSDTYNGSPVGSGCCAGHVAANVARMIAAAKVRMGLIARGVHAELWPFCTALASARKGDAEQGTEVVDSA
jgi:hypothetical protein